MVHSPRYISLCAGLALAFGVPGAGLAAAASGGPQAVQVLNRERAADGLPAGITLDPTLSSDCAAHDRYMAVHGLTHGETRGSRGYTPGGAAAASGSVLAAGEGWAAGNPYLDAPLHLDQLLAPRLAVIGSADVAGFSCTTTFPGWTRGDPPALHIYTDPGQGQREVPRSEVAVESPYTPGQLVGLAAGARTGPVLTVLADAPGRSAENDPATLTGVRLISPHGAVAVRTVDGTTPVPGGGTVARYISPGGFIIPVTPLSPGTTYHAQAVVGFAGAQTPVAWSFTTASRAPGSSLELSGGALGFRSASSTTAIVSFTRTGGGSSPAVRIAPGHSVTLHLAAGTWQACATQAARGGYSAYSGCITLTVTGIPRLRFGPPRPSGDSVLFPVRASRVLRGRPATLIVELIDGGKLIRTRTETIRIGGALSEPRPPRGDAWTLTLSVAQFTVRSVPYAASSATVRWPER